MRATYIFITILCLIPFVSFILYKKIKKKEGTSFIGTLFVCIMAGLILAALINGASPEVITVNGNNKADCHTHRYFLFFVSDNGDNTHSIHFLRPYSNSKVFNNSNSAIDYQILKYPYDKEVELFGHAIHIQPHSFFSPKIETVYLFEPIIKEKWAYKKNRPIHTCGVLLPNNGVITYR